ncbi:hypothetical protein BZG04_01335 [Salinivibrio kushneri]|nr:hypothetical protein BZG04_01335 [Salinivibrio kushneri]
MPTVHLLLHHLVGLVGFTRTPLDTASVKNNDLHYERYSVWFSGEFGVTRAHAHAWEREKTPVRFGRPTGCTAKTLCGPDRTQAPEGLIVFASLLQGRAGTQPARPFLLDIIN